MGKYKTIKKLDIDGILNNYAIIKNIKLMSRL